MSATPQVEDRPVALLLSFVGGFVDTFSFVVLFGLFTAHVTGNFVLIGAALARQGHHGVIAKLLALPVFIATVAATRWLQRKRERGGAALARPVVAAQLAALLAFMAAGMLAGPFDNPDGLAAIATSLVGVVAMAIQNAASRSVFAQLSPSTVMTGNVTQATMDLVDVALEDVPIAPTRARIAKMWPPIVAFAAGAATAGLCCGRLGFPALLLPAAALLLLWVRLSHQADAP